MRTRLAIIILFIVMLSMTSAINFSILAINKRNLGDSISENKYFSSEKPNSNHELKESSTSNTNLKIQTDEVYTGWTDPYRPLAEYWAPVIHQLAESDDSLGYKQDFITKFDYDGDWIGNNNWDNLPYYLTPAYVYYAVIETETHYFIFYALFHPRDWGNAYGIIPDTHENDMEAVMLVITKDGSQYGSLLLIETRAHTDFYQYSNDPNIGDGSDNIDGGIEFEGSRPIIYVQAQGHGIYCNYDQASSTYSHSAEYIYRYYGYADTPNLSSASTNVSYDLIPILTTLWPKRYDIGDGRTYGTSFNYSGARFSFQNPISGAFDGDDGSDDAANPPWGMDDGDDGAVYRGDWFLDPAYTVATHLSIPYEFSQTYTFNPYLIEDGPDLSSPPTINIISPAEDGKYGSSSIFVSWSVSDDDEVRYVDVWVDGSFQGRYFSTSGSFTINLGDGEHTLNITAVDYWGNYRTIIRRFWVDTKAPNIEITSPTDRMTYTTSSIYLEVVVSDNFELGSLEILINGSSYANIPLSGTQYTYSADITLGDGVWVITAKVWDWVNLINETSILIKIDTTPPQVTILSPSDQAVFTVREIPLEWEGSDNFYVDHYELYVNGDLIATLPNTTTTYTLNLSSGLYTIMVRAVDASGFAALDSVDIKVDVDPPQVTIISPLNDTLVPQSFYVNWSASDNFGIVKTELYINNSVPIIVNGNSYEVQLSESGYYYIKVVVYDDVGFSAYSIVFVECDIDPPKIIFDQENNTIYNVSYVFISWTIIEMTEIDSRYISVDGADFVKIFKDNITISLSEGQHEIRIKAVDIAGNEGISTLIVIVDSEPPQVQIVSPNNETYTNRTELPVEWDAWDACGITKQELYLDGRLVAIVNQGNSWSVSLTGGQHEIVVVVYDYAGRSATSLVRVYVDTQPPTILVFLPEDQAKLSGEITIQWNVTDNLSGIGKVLIFVNDTIYTRYVSYGEITMNLDPSAYIITLKVYDGAGNTMVESHTIYIAGLHIKYPIDGANISDLSFIVGLYRLYVNMVNVYINGTLWASGITTDNFEVSVESDGVWNITVVDANSTEFWDSILVRVDTTPPYLDAWTSKEVYNVSEIDLSWSALDEGAGLESIRIYANGTLIQEDSRKEATVILSLGDGAWSITILAMDYAGNTYSKSLSVIVDTVPPHVDISMKNGTRLNTTDVYFEWFVTDNLTGVEQVFVYVDEEFVGFGVAGNISLELLNGLHWIVIEARDMAGNKIRVSVYFVINAPPVLILYGVSSNVTYVNTPDLNITWELFNGEVEEASAFLNGTPISVENGYIYVPGLEEGVYELTLVVVDSNGFEYNKTVYIVVDLTAPGLEILWPVDGAYINMTHVLFRVDYWDNFGLQAIYVIINGELYEVPLGHSFYVDAALGENIIVVRAVDLAGNFVDREVRFTVDTKPPVLNLLSPKNASAFNISTNITLSWFARDDNKLNRTLIFINGELVAVLAPNITEYNLTLTENLTIRIVTYDMAGNKAESVLILYVYGAPQEEGTTEPEDSKAPSIPAVPIAIASVVALTLFVVFFRRKRSPSNIEGLPVESEPINMDEIGGETPTEESSGEASGEEISDLEEELDRLSEFFEF